MELILYDNKLAVDKFVHMLDDTTQCYKFYWLDSILTLLANGKTEMTFEEVIDGMIADAWYSVKEYHLHLGLRNQEGKSTDSLESAVLKLMAVSTLGSNACREEILQEITKHNQVIRGEKQTLAKNVPYRLLSSFLSDVSGSDRIWDQKQRLITYVESIDRKDCLPYRIRDGRGLDKKVIINDQWVKMLCDNMVTIKGWIQIKKVKYLQDRNPGVPGIIYKLEPENEKTRKLKYVRELWNSIIDVRPIKDIYTDNAIVPKDYEVDHFVPWSYIANDEMWNLIPMESSLNSSKSNRLPNWETYFEKFAKNQYILYNLVHTNEKLHEKFNKCQRDNLVSIWANEKLYIPGNSEERFCSILENHLKPVYDAARIQGYQMWLR